MKVTVTIDMPPVPQRREWVITWGQVSKVPESFLARRNPK